MQNCSIQWNTVLTQNQRDAWDLYASNIVWQSSLSEAVFLTGLNHYIRTNVPRMMCGLDKLQDAPCLFDLAIPEQALTASASVATTVVSLAFDDTAPWCSETGGFQIFYMGKPKNASTKFFDGPWRHLCCSLGEDPVAAITGNIKGNGKKSKGEASPDDTAQAALQPPAPLTPPASPLECPTVWPLCEGCRIWVRSRVGRADGRLSDFASYNFLCGP